MAQGDQILSQKGTSTLLVNGSLIWVEGGPDWGTPSQRQQLDELLKDKQGNQALKKFVIANLVIIAARAFHETASRGCSAKTVNRLLLQLVASFAYGSFFLSTVKALLACIIKGLEKAIPAGSLAFVKHGAAGSIEYRSPEGALLADTALSIPASQGAIIGGDSLVSGVFAIQTWSAFLLTVFNPARASVGSLTFTARLDSVNTVSSSETDFYVARLLAGNVTTAFDKISNAGVVLQSWTLPALGEAPFAADIIVHAFGVAWDGQKAYYVGQNQSGDGKKAILQYNLGSSTGSPFTSDPDLTAEGVIVLRDGTVVTLWQSSSVSEVRVFNPAGVLQALYSVPIGDGNTGQLRRGDDDTYVWVWLNKQVIKLHLSDGRHLEDFYLPYESGDGFKMVVVTTVQAGI